FMPIDAELGIEWKVAAELKKEGTKIAVYGIGIVGVHHCRRAHDPRIGQPRPGAPALLGAEYGGLLLRLADEYYPFLFLELGQILFHPLVFALTLTKMHNGNCILRDVALKRRYEAAGHRAHQSRGGQRLFAMVAKEPHNSLLALQPRHIDIEIHPVDAFDRKHHMITEDVGDGLCYHVSGSGRAVICPLRARPLTVSWSLVYQSSLSTADR